LSYGTETSNRGNGLLKALVVIAIVVVAYWATTAGLGWEAGAGSTTTSTPTVTTGPADSTTTTAVLVTTVPVGSTLAPDTTTGG
jgi:hypothetical protein